VIATLRSPRLRRILAAYTVNRLGTWFGLVALSLAVFDHTHSALAVASMLVAGQVLPAFAVPFVVARVEASSRRGELSALYVFEGVVTAALAVLLWHFWLPAVLFLVALDGTAALAASALLRAETARVAIDELDIAAEATSNRARERLGPDPRAAQQHANAALNVAFSATFVLGPAIGGAVVAGAGAPTALLLDAASFLICGALLADLRPHVEDAAGSTVRARLRGAWAHVNAVPALRTLLLAQAVGLVFFESAAPIEVAYVKATLGAGDRGYGLLVATWGVGVVLGSIVFARSAKRPLGAMLSAGTLAVGLAYLGFAAAPSLALACAAAVIGGVGNGVQWASLISAVQRLTPQRLHGQLMGAVEALAALCPAIGLALGGILVALSTPRVAFLVTGLGATATTVMFLRAQLGRAVRASDGDADGVRVASNLLEPRPNEATGILGAAQIQDRPADPRPAPSRTP
jgi:MFS transporter